MSPLNSNSTTTRANSKKTLRMDIKTGMLHSACATPSEQVEFLNIIHRDELNNSGLQGPSSKEALSFITEPNIMENSAKRLTKTPLLNKKSHEEKGKKASRSSMV